MTTLALNRLSRQDCVALICAAADEETLADGVIEQLSQEADGVPLFVEELARAVSEGAYIDTPNASRDVPTRLQALLNARLDKLPNGKSVAQIGAVIGRSFSRDVAAQVSEIEPSSFTLGIDELVASGLLL